MLIRGAVCAGMLSTAVTWEPFADLHQRWIGRRSWAEGQAAAAARRAVGAGVACRASGEEDLRHRAARRVAFRTAEGRVRVGCGAERLQRLATGSGAVRCAGGWRADAWGCRRGSVCRVQAGGILLRQEHQEQQGSRRCASVGRNRQSAGDNEPLVCRSLQVVSYVRDSGFAVRIKGGV